MPSSEKNKPRFQKLIQIIKSRKAQNAEISILAAIIFVFSLLLTFSDPFYLILGRYTPRPELLPFSLLIPLIWIVFQVTLLERESKGEGHMPEAIGVIRNVHLQEWVLSRETMLRFFIEGSGTSKQWKSVSVATPTLVEWIQATSPNLNLDILAFSTETFLPPCLDAASVIAEQSVPKIKQVNVRILIRDINVDWLIPYIADNKADHEYVHDLKARFLHQQSNWTGLVLREFGRVLPASKIRLEMRMYPIEPVFKGIIINQEMGLVGIYPLGRTSWRGMEVWDYLGHETPMVQIAKSSESLFERTSFELFLKWFNDLWNNNSRVWQTQ